MTAHKDLFTTRVLVAANKAALDSVVGNYQQGQLGVAKDVNYLYYIDVVNNNKIWTRLVT